MHELCNGESLVQIVNCSMAVAYGSTKNYQLEFQRDCGVCTRRRDLGRSVYALIPLSLCFTLTLLKAEDNVSFSVNALLWTEKRSHQFIQAVTISLEG